MSYRIGLRHAVFLAALGLWCCAPDAAVAGKWNQPGGKGSPITLTYSYVNLLKGGGLDLSSGFSDYEVVEKVEDAFAVWSRYTPISFQQVKDGGGVNIRISRTGLDGALGWAKYPPNNQYTGSLPLRLDDSNRTWNADALRAVTAHEVGHNLGLLHYTGDTALMNVSQGLTQTMKDKIRDGELFSHDISDIRGKYGSGSGEVMNTRFWKGPADELLNWTSDGDWRVAENADSSEPAFRPTINSNVVINRGAVLINGGTQVGRKMVVGENAGESAQLKVTGGSLTLRHGGGLTLGESGSGHVQHLGGTVDCQQLRLGGRSSNETAVYELDGGVLRIHGNVTDFGSGRSTLKLRGGTFALGDVGNVTVDELVFDGQANRQTLTWNKRGKTFHVKDTMKMGTSSSGKSATFTLRRGTLRVDGDVTDGPDTSKLYLHGGYTNISGSITVDELRISNSSASSDHTFTFGNNVTANSMIQVGGGRNGMYTQQGGRVETAHLQLAGIISGRSGTYNLDGGVLAVNGNVIDGGSGTSTLNIDGGNLQVAGSIALDYLYIGKDSDGTLTRNGDITLNTKLRIGERAAGTFTQTGGTVTVGTDNLTVGNKDGGRGTYNLQGGTLSVNSPLRIGDDAGSQGIFNQTGGGVTVNGNLQLGHAGGTGVYNLDGGSLNVNGNITDGGGDSTLNVDGGVLEIVGDGSLEVDTLNFYGGALRNVATIDARFNHRGGVYSPGTATGLVEIDGGYTMQPQSTLLIDLPSTDWAHQFDRLAVDGDVLLDGTLQINVLNGFQRPLRQTFTIISADSITGEFDAVQPQPSAGAASHIGRGAFLRDVHYVKKDPPLDQITTAVDLDLFIAWAGDVDGDGLIGLDDWDEFRNNFGESGMDWTGGNFDSWDNGVVDLDDWDKFRDNFGKNYATAGAGGGAAAVPEPGTIVMLLGGLAGLVVLSCRRRQ